MKTLPLLFSLFLLLVQLAHSQASNPITIVYVTTAPSGACSSAYLPIRYVVPTTGALYGCLSGTWTALSGGGGGGGVSSVDATGGVQTVSGSAITTTGTIRGAWVRNAQTGTTYTVLTGDRGKTVTFSNAASIAVTLPQAGSGFEDGWFFVAKNIGAGTVTITPTTSTVDGAATITLLTGDFAVITSNGTNYETANNKIISGTNINVTAARIGKSLAVTAAGSSNDIQVNNSGVLGGGRCTMDSSQNLTCSGTVAAPVVSATGTTAGELSIYELAANGTEYFSWLAADAITTTQRLKPPIAANAADQTMKFGAPSSNVSAATWGLPLWANTTNANGYYDWTLGSAPGSPASGDIRLYPKTGSTLCAKDSGGTETCFGSGGGSAVAPFYAPFGGPNANFATVSIGAANRVWFVAANAPHAMSVSNINVLMGTSSQYMALGFYSGDCTTKLGQTATTNSSSIAVTLAVNGGPITIPAGKFYVAFTGVSSGSLLYGTSGSYFIDAWNIGATPEYFYVSGNDSTGTSTLTLPSSCTGTRTAASSTSLTAPGIVLY